MKYKYNRAAELLSDSNSYPGIDMVRFGETIDEIIGLERLRKELVPEKAFREALANAIVHRLWNLRSSITISMYENRIEIVSP